MAGAKLKDRALGGGEILNVITPLLFRRPKIYVELEKFGKINKIIKRVLNSARHTPLLILPRGEG